MLAEQALFTSVNAQHKQGYQLVARSPGIDADMAQSLRRWAPSHGALIDPRPDAWCLSAFRVDANHLAVARTTYGGAEYSGRGGMRVVTAFLLMPYQNLARYDDDPLLLARTAMASGFLRLPNPLNDYGRPVRLPDRAFPVATRPPESLPNEAIARAVDAALSKRRVVVIGASHPTDMMQHILRRLPLARRLETSFTTGLNWSTQRAFQVQFLPAADTPLRQRLRSQQVVCVDAA